MITTAQIPEGRLLADKFLLTDTPHPDYINLTLTKGEPMRYGTGKTKIIDFPGEYDVDNYTITSYEAGDVLHYQIILDGESIVIIQSPALLEKETVGDVHTWICTDEACKAAIERDELEGEIVVLTAA